QPHTAHAGAVPPGDGAGVSASARRGSTPRPGPGPALRPGKPLPSASSGGRLPDPQARERNVLITHDTRCALDTVVDLVNTAPGASVADHLAADCGMALAFFVVAGEQERLRRCEAPDCRRAFVDLSRNRSRRYCDSRTCGNRLHVAAYRARRKEAAG